MSSSTTGTAAPTPGGSIRGDPAPPAASTNEHGLVIPEGKVAVWDNTMKQMVIKDRDEVKLKVRLLIVRFIVVTLGFRSTIIVEFTINFNVALRGGCVKAAADIHYTRTPRVSEGEYEPGRLA